MLWLAHMRWISFVPFLILTLQTEAASKRQLKHDLTIGIVRTMPVNDNPALTKYIPYPYLFYENKSYKLPRVSTSFLTAGLVNRANTKYRIIKNLHFNAGIEAVFSFGPWTLEGDEPRIDGAGLSDYEFKAHRGSGRMGLTYELPTSFEPLRFMLIYNLDYYYIFDKSNSVNFIAPRSFIEQGPSFIAELGKKKPHSELTDHGLRIRVEIAPRLRSNNRQWGVVGNERDVGPSFRSSAGVSYARRVADLLSLVTKAQGGFVSKVDRMNAIRSSPTGLEGLGMFTRDIRAQSMITGELGFRYYVEKDETFAVRPFFHFAAYRELTPIEFRNDTLIGAGLRFIGRTGSRFFWAFTYGNAYGNRKDVSGLHEIKLEVSYNILP